MKRRTNLISGCVNFPIDDTQWKNSREGGLIVKLVVCDNRAKDTQFAMCCGSTVTDILTENLVGDDRRPYPSLNDYSSLESIQTGQKGIEDWIEYHYPAYADNGQFCAEGTDRYLSRDYLSVIIMGSTGWSGRNIDTGLSWCCHYSDLNTDGKKLYRQIEKLYPGCDLHLLTFLDT